MDVGNPHKILDYLKVLLQRDQCTRGGLQVHLQQRIAKQQNHNQIIRHEYHYQQ